MPMTATSVIDRHPESAIRDAASKPLIRVAHLIHTMAHGGVETALINWMKTFDRRRIEAHLLCFANPGRTEQPFVDAATRAGLKLARVPWGRLKPLHRAARATADFVAARQIDILHCHNAYADMVGLLAARRRPVKIVTTVYLWSEVGWKRRVLQRIDERLLRHFDQVTAHCSTALQATVERGIPEERLRLLTCGFADRVAELTEVERDAGRGHLGAAPGETVLINVARFWPEKRHDVLLRAFDILSRRRRNVRLWIPGVGPQEAEIRALARELNLETRVQFLGFRNDLPELLAMADIQVHTSDEEGVPLAVLSGMAAARPIVSTAVGGIAEVIRHGQSGVLVPRRDASAIADAIESLMLNPAEAFRLGQAAQRFIRDDYSLEAATRRVQEVYDEVLGR
jgi:glycosyltransferase involved in cell wall biosynthesis